MFTSIITKALVAADRAAMQAKVRCTVIKEVVGIAHQEIKASLPEYKEQLEGRILDKVHKQLGKKTSISEADTEA